MIAVGAAAALSQNRFIAQLFVGLDHRLDDGRVVGQAVGLVVVHVLQFQLAAPTGRGLLQRVDDDLAEERQLVIVAAAGLAKEMHLGRDCVAGGAALDGAHVAGGFMIHPAQRHTNQRFGCDGQGVDARLGPKARVRAAPFDGDQKFVGRGAAAGDLARPAAGVQHQTPAGFEAAHVQIAGSLQSQLLFHRQHHFDGRVRQILLLDLLQDLQDDGDARLVITAQHCRAIGIDDAIADDGLDAAAGLHRVHVARKQDVFARAIFQPGDEIAVVVHLGSQAQSLETADHFFPEFSLLAAGTVDLHELQECLH